MFVSRMSIKGDKQLKAKLAKMSKEAVGPKHAIAVAAGAEVIRTAAVQNVHRKLNRDPTGNLARSLKVTPMPLPPGIQISAYIGTNEVYAKIHEFGGTIEAKRAPMLVFEVEPGVWISVPWVEIPARPYLRPAFDRREFMAWRTIAKVFKKLVLDKVAI